MIINKKTEFYKSIGYDTEEAFQYIEKYLIANNLTNSRKVDFSDEKKIKIENMLRMKFLKLCDDKACRDILKNLNSVARKKCEFTNNEILRVSSRNCDICRGGDAYKAAMECIGVIDGRKINILIIGHPGEAKERLGALLKNKFVEPNIEYDLFNGDKVTKSTNKSLKHKCNKYDYILIWEHYVPAHARTNIIKNCNTSRSFNGAYIDLFRKVITFAAGEKRVVA